MSHRGSLRTLVAVALLLLLLLCATVADAVCVSQVREASSGVFNRRTTAVAWSGTVLGVAKVDESGNRSIQFATFSEDLVPQTFDYTITAGSFLGVTSLQWTGSEFALFYQDTSRQLFMQRVSAGGDPIGSASAIAANHPALSDREYDVAWDVTRQAFLVVTSISTGLDKGLWLIMVNRDGSVRSDQVITTNVVTPVSPRIAANKNGLMAVIFRRTGLFWIRVYDATGVGGGIQPVVIARDARIAAGSNNTFVVVGNSPVDAPTEILWSIADEHGNLVLQATKLLSAHGVEIAPVSLLWNETRSEWALAYLDAPFPITQVAPNYRLRRFTASGTLISDSMFSVVGVLERLTTDQPSVWTGSSYVSAAGRVASSTGTPESYVIRLCPLDATISAPQFLRVAQNATFTANAEGGASERTFSWNFGDGHTETGQSITHRYERLGDYTVVLRVTDSMGATTVTTFDVHVIVPKRRGVKP